MICPHCSQDVKAKERTGHRCSKCGKAFATDPKDNDLKLHDVRLGRLIAHVSDNGTYAFTYQQLYWAAAAKRLKEAAHSSPLLGASVVMVLIGTVFLIVAASTRSAVPLLVTLLLYGAVIVAVTLRLTGAWPKRIRMSTSAAAFDEMIKAWGRVYGGKPPRLVRRAAPAPAPAAPVLAVLSPDISVLTCLAANNVPQQFGVVLAAQLAEIPPGVPVLLLHDVSVAGYLFAVQARAMLPGRRVLDASPRPSAVRTASGAPKLLEGPPPRPQLDALRADGHLSDADLAWLARGWWSPIAALRPASLVNRVRTALGRLRVTDPDTRAAATVGFLTWPAA
jgi:hypothetical protein